MLKASAVFYFQLLIKWKHVFVGTLNFFVFPHISLFCQLLAVEILVSGFVFEKEDFVRPWEVQHDNLER